MGQQFIATTTMGPTEIEHHSVGWDKEVDLTDDKIVKAEFETSDPQLEIHWRNWTDTDTTLCLNGNGIAPGRYYAHHTVYLASRSGSQTSVNRKLRRTVLVRVVER